VKYGPGSGGTVGNPITTASGFTAGLYFVNVAGNNVASFAADPTGNSAIASLYSGPGAVVVGSGGGSSGGIASASDVFGAAGKYAPATTFNPGLGAGATITLMVVAYNGASYQNATIRGHSTAFTMTTSVGTAFAANSGDFETDGGFSVTPVPEPSVLALSGLGAAALMAIRRKKVA